ncbi:MAG: hypothetical protein DMF85_10495 [Acidobacteria bacterium]|nr:MAG: hypothetical protein DMF85_10495 [Acidobacteriota bacterium]
MTQKAVWGARIRFVIAVAAAMSVAACSSQVREGQGSSYLIVTSLQAAPGSTPGTFATILLSDVVTNVGTPPTATFFNDLGQVTLQLVMKDPGGTVSPNLPTPNNFITLEQYHVEFVRSDGHNVPGVDVPFAFDGVMTATISGTASIAFTLVRHQSKQEAPLAALATNPIIITTIAKVTFFGHDQTGHSASVSGNIEVAFGNFAD